MHHLVFCMGDLIVFLAMPMLVHWLLLLHHLVETIAGLHNCGGKLTVFAVFFLSRGWDVHFVASVMVKCWAYVLSINSFCIPQRMLFLGFTDYNTASGWG